ncbi:hypothetical protein B0J14DRAFT_296996 [Halenospora varia]|nr:hypothetical protein B0J14DRAFT_296996 [Halenospora varia]
MSTSSTPTHATERKVRHRIRAKKPKVRSGCRTCKIRHAKCDETRPFCLRCLKFGSDFCAGYDSPPTQASLIRAQSAAAQNQTDSSVSLRRIVPATVKEDVNLGLGFVKFRTQDEYCSFAYYCEEVAPRLSYSSRTVWMGTVLREAESLEFIRCAVVAIGCLSRVSRAKEESGGYEDFETRRCRGVALDHYGRFLNGTKKYMAGVTRDEGRRLTMIACLLVVCIENMQFNSKGALAHAMQGLQLVEEMKMKDSASPPRHMVIEERLVEQFERMELLVLTKAVAGKSGDKGGKGDIDIENMPGTFTTIDEASTYFHLVGRKAYHWIAATHGDKKRAYTDIENDRNYGQSSEIRKLRARLHDQQENIQAELRRWRQAFSPIATSALQNLEGIEAFEVLLKKAHSIVASLRVADHLAQTELHWDNHISQMQTIVSIGRILLNHPLWVERQFSFDGGLIVPLMLVAMKCRGRMLRREAIDLLGKRYWREAHWCSTTNAEAGRILVDLEEEGVETDFIPEWARVDIIGVKMCQETETVRLTYIRGAGDTAERHECVRDWSWDIPRPLEMEALPQKLSPRQIPKPLERPREPEDES